LRHEKADFLAPPENGQAMQNREEVFMRVAIFTEAYLPYLNGVVTHIKILREGLIHNGHEVLIVTADKNVREHVLKDGVLRCPAVDLKKLYATAFRAR
jgi:hypothetical protein